MEVDKSESENNFLQILIDPFFQGWFVQCWLWPYGFPNCLAIACRSNCG